MKIKYDDGREDDTNEMNDIASHLAEESQRILTFCQKHNISAWFEFVDPIMTERGLRCMGFTSIGNEEKFTVILRAIDAYLAKNTNLRLVPWDTVKHLFPDGDTFQ